MLKLNKKCDDLFYFYTEDGEEVICRAIGSAVEIFLSAKEGIYTVAKRLESVFSQDKIFPEELKEFQEAWIVRIKYGEFKWHMVADHVTLDNILARWNLEQVK